MSILEKIKKDQQQPEELKAMEQPKEPKHSRVVGYLYKGQFLHQVVLPNGQIVKPNEFGYFTPSTPELKEMLEYYCKTGNCIKEPVFE